MKEIDTFLKVYSRNRGINRDFFKLVPEDKFDFRMVDTPTRKSDSPRESLAHLLAVQLAYIEGLESKKLDFKNKKIERFIGMSKSELLMKMEGVDTEMGELLSNKDFNPHQLISAPWGERSAISILYDLNSHEILHNGYNLALMDHLDIPRFESLIKVWG